MLGNLGCLGNETRLVDCPSGDVSSCTHSEDAGVRCLLQTGKMSRVCFFILLDSRAHYLCP